MKFSILLSFLLLCLSLNAQLIVQDSFLVEGTVDDNLLGKDFPVTNEGTSELTFYWKLVRHDDVHKDWIFSICDKIACWPDNIVTGSCDDPNVMIAEEVYELYKVGLKPMGAKGRGTVTFYLMSECENIEDDKVIAKTVHTFDVSGGVATEELSQEIAYNLYPNPSSELISIANDESVSEVSFYSSSGQLLGSEAHNTGMQHDISQLKAGLYFVELKAKNQQVIKTMRMIKIE